MSNLTLLDLQASIKDHTAFNQLEDYFLLGTAFLRLIEQTQPTRIVSPNRSHYIFYQYAEEYHHSITRPLNTTLFFEDTTAFQNAFERFVLFLDDLKKYQAAVEQQPGIAAYLESREIDRVIYTMQQAIGCIGDSFTDSNQARKRIGQLFEALVKLIIQSVGLTCDSRTVVLPVPGFPGYTMPYELDIVFSRHNAVITGETPSIYLHEIVGSIKTTSKDRLDKIFLDKFLLTKLLGRDIPVIAIFLHDVQRTKRGTSIFGINSTFKSNHFLGYTVALNRLDGVYYVDLAPEIMSNALLSTEIRDFQRFLVHDLWTLSASG